MKILHREFLKTETPTCHASTIAFFKDEPYFAWFGGEREGLPDSTIYVQKGDKVVKMQNRGIAQWNPVLFPYEDDLYLFWKVGLFCDRWCSMLSTVDENLNIKGNMGLAAGLNGPVKTKPIIFERNNKSLILCGSSVETILDWSVYIEQYTIKNGRLRYVDRSRPLTVPKVIYEDPMGIKRVTLGIIQPSLWQDSKGNIHAFCRSSHGLNKVYYLKSYRNKGRLEWEEPIPTEFLNPNASIDTVYFNERLFLVHNPSSTKRSPLILSELNEELKEVDELIIRDKIDDIDETMTPELSYPFLIENDGKLHLTYTYGRSKIEHIIIDP